VRDAYTWLLSDLLEPANILAVADLDLDLHDMPFAHNYPTVAALLGIIEKRDIPNSPDFWSVHVIGAYEGPTENDFHPNNEDADLGQSSWTRTAFLIYEETIRDLQQFWSTHMPMLPAANTPDVFEARTVAHEVGHLLGGFSHGAGVTDEGVMNPTNNLRGDHIVNVFYHWQLGRMQSSRMPGDLR
jgi:hypothetical protein